MNASIDAIWLFSFDKALANYVMTVYQAISSPLYECLW